MAFQGYGGDFGEFLNELDGLGERIRTGVGGDDDGRGKDVGGEGGQGGILQGLDIQLMKMKMKMKTSMVSLNTKGVN